MIAKLRWPVLVACVAVFPSCSTTQWQSPSPPDPYRTGNTEEGEVSRESPSISDESVDRYVGTLPCAKCDGIRTDLRLFTDSTGEPTRFELDETYLNTSEGDQNYTTKGKWRIFHGSPGDPHAIIYEFESKQTGVMSFLVLEKLYEIRLLDRSHGELDIAIPHTLTRVDRDAFDPMVVSLEPPGKELDLKKNQLLVVRLTSNAATGFHWSLADSTGGVLQLQGDPDYVPDSEGPNMVGTVGTELWRFRAAHEGNQSLVFVYRRSAEVSPTDEKITLTAKVH
ncbi:MAG TPA: protease inhibitor I42 family protein [bacterium]|nr:protease inhibitor I42 family protein [bacterium]